MERRLGRRDVVHAPDERGGEVLEHELVAVEPVRAAEPVAERGAADPPAVELDRSPGLGGNDDLLALERAGPHPPDAGELVGRRLLLGLRPRTCVAVDQAPAVVDQEGEPVLLDGRGEAAAEDRELVLVLGVGLRRALPALAGRLGELDPVTGRLPATGERRAGGRRGQRAVVLEPEGRAAQDRARGLAVEERLEHPVRPDQLARRDRRHRAEPQLDVVAGEQQVVAVAGDAGHGAQGGHESGLRGHDLGLAGHLGAADAVEPQSVAVEGVRAGVVVAERLAAGLGAVEGQGRAAALGLRQRVPGRGPGDELPLTGDVHRRRTAPGRRGAAGQEQHRQQQRGACHGTEREPRALPGATHRPGRYANEPGERCSPGSFRPLRPVSACGAPSRVLSSAGPLRRR